MSVSVELINKAEHLPYFAGMLPEEYVRQLPDRKYLLLGALDETVPVGAALVELQEEYGELLSVFVADDHRRQGVASALLLEAVRLLQVLSAMGLYTVILPGQEEAAAFLQSFGMELEEEDQAWECRLDQLTEKLPPAKKQNTTALEKIPAASYRSFAVETFGTAQGVMARDSFDGEMSRVVMEADEVSGAILIQRTENGISVEWLQSSSKDQYSTLYLVQDAAAAARQTLPPEAVVRFLSGSEALQRLVEKLVGDQAVTWKEQRWSISDAAFRLKGLDELAPDDDSDMEKEG